MADELKAQILALMQERLNLQLEVVRGSYGQADRLVAKLLVDDKVVSEDAVPL